MVKVLRGHTTNRRTQTELSHVVKLHTSQNSDYPPPNTDSRKLVAKVSHRAGNLERPANLNRPTTDFDPSGSRHNQRRLRSRLNHPRSRTRLNHQDYDPDSTTVQTQTPGLNNTYAKILRTRNYKQNFTRVNSYKGNSRYKRYTQYLR